MIRPLPIEGVERNCAGVPSLPERLARWVLGGPLERMLLLFCGFLLACWVPQYLTWIYYGDMDEFATMAHGWASGSVLPYRDFPSFNFPGQIYWFWTIGKLFGWSSVVAFQAADALMVLAFGLALIVLEKGRDGSRLSGTVGFVAFCYFYFDCNYDMTGQRDWQASFFGALALIIADRDPTPRGRACSAVAMAAGFAFRPQVVLFLPSVFLLLGAPGSQTEKPRAESLPGWLEWLFVFVASALLCFLPLGAAGLMGDFLRGVRMAAPGSEYGAGSHASLAKRSFELCAQLAAGRILFVSLISTLFLPLCSRRQRRRVMAFLVALAAAVVYGSISPIRWNYHDLPIVVFWSLALCSLVQTVEEIELSPLFRLVTVLFLLALALPHKPYFVRPRASLAAVWGATRGDRDELPNFGYIRKPSNTDRTVAYYDWQDYRDAMRYVRMMVPPNTRVANALGMIPAFTGPLGRLSAFPTSSLGYPLMVPSAKASFTEALEKAADSVVVWNPREPQVWDELRAIILKHYAPEARFGRIELWRRR